MSDAIQANAQSRQRKAVVPPAHVPPEMTVFEYLTKCTPPLDQKIIDIACSQSSVPTEHKKDAAQEIRLMWTTIKPDTERFKPGQIAAYAHRMACHAALRLRREVGAPVRLPGSAFRKRKDGSSYVTPGVLAAALDWDKLEGWFQADGAEGESSAVSDAISSDLGLQPLFEGEEAAVEEDDEEVSRDERREILERSRDELTPRQYAIMEALIAGATYEDIQREQDIKEGVLMREVAIVSSIIGILD